MILHSQFSILNFFAKAAGVAKAMFPGRVCVRPSSVGYLVFVPATVDPTMLQPAGLHEVHGVHTCPRIATASR